MFYSPFIVVSSLVAGTFATARTSAPSGAITVATSGGDYTSVQDAVDSITSSGAVIFIESGTYEEQVLIPASVGSLTIYGYTEDDQDYSQNTVTITHSLGADDAENNDATGTLRAKNDNLSVYNVNIENSRGEGDQAIALSAYGSEQGYYGCQFLGYQDTVLSEEGYHYFHGSYIEGATDFIFGQEAVAWFESCTIGISAAGYITANGRDSDSNPSYYVFNQATVEALSGVGEGETYLGRPWREYSRVVFQNSELGAVVNSAGWTTWDDSSSTANVYYGEYGNSGDGASGTRVSFATTLSSAVTLSDILGSTDWLDTDYIDGTSSSDSTASSTPASSTPAATQTEASAATSTAASDSAETPSFEDDVATTTAQDASQATSGGWDFQNSNPWGNKESFGGNAVARAEASTFRRVVRSAQATAAV